METRTQKTSLSERCLAGHLVRKGIRFRQQVSIGKYCVDFLVQPNLVVEAEGKVHSPKQDRDLERTSALEGMGYRVFRVPNYTIFRDPDGVAEMIRVQSLGARSR